MRSLNLHCGMGLKFRVLRHEPPVAARCGCCLLGFKDIGERAEAVAFSSR